MQQAACEQIRTVFTSAKEVMFSTALVCLLAGLYAGTTQASFTYNATEDFDGSPDHVTLAL